MKNSENPIESSVQAEGELSPDLKKLTIPRASSSESSAPQDSKNPVSSPQDQSNQFLLQLALRSHQYVNEFIKLADQKAAFVFALSTGTLALFYQDSIQLRFVKPLSNWTLLDGLYLIAVGLLVVSTFLAFLTVKPRLKPSKPSGLIFWESVASFDNANEYFKRILDLNQQGVLQELFDHHYRLSQVCKGKYDSLKASIFLGGVGIVLSVLLIVFGSK